MSQSDPFVIMYIFNMTEKRHMKEGGFIALISVLILSTVLLATTLSLAQFGIANRYFILDLEQKAASVKLAEACVHISRITAYNNPVYVLTSPVFFEIGGGVCSVYSMSVAGTATTIEATARVGDAVTNLRVVMDHTNGDFLCWREVQTFVISGCDF